MTEDSSVPQDHPDRDDAPVTGDVTGRTHGRAPEADTAEPPVEPTVTPEQDDPDREGEDRFDAG